MNLGDIRTVVWKEWQELGDTLGGGSRAQILALFFVVLFFGVLSPLRQGPGWYTSPMALGLYAFVGMVLLMGPIADAFAGERERHTLETLLATRLDDSAILLGKLFGVLLPIWGITTLVYGVAIVATNVQYGRGQLLLPPAWSVAVTLGAILLIPSLVAGVGIFVSLRSATVRKAAQLLSLSVMAIFLLPTALIKITPHTWRERVVTALAGTTPARIGLGAAAVLLALDVAIVAAALLRFRRGRLVLD